MATSEYNKKYYQEHRQQKREYDRLYYQKHKAELNEKSKRYNETHKEQMRAYRQRYFQEHKEKLTEQNKKAHARFVEKVDWGEYCANARRKRVERLKAQGCTNAWSVCVMGYDPKYKEKGDEKNERCFK